MTTERLVLDSSFVLEAVLPTSKKWSTEAVDWVERIALGEVDARVPWIFFAELAAVVARRVRGRQLSRDAARAFIEQTDSVGIHVDLTLEQSYALHGAAMLWNAGAYDAIYLGVAKRMATPVATRDKGMIAAARDASVEIFQPTR